MSAGRVVVQPSGIEIVLEPDESLLTAAQRSGYRWPTVCGGQGTCRTCYVLVEQGAENCSAVSGLEAEGLEVLRRTVAGHVRLACQLHVSGGTATVHKRGVRPLRPEAADTPTTTVEPS